MSRLKKHATVIAMFLLLFAVVLTPLFYFEYQNEHVLMEFFVSPTHTAHLDIPSAQKQNYSIWERLDILNASVTVRASVPVESKTELRKKMEEQLAAVALYQALPDLSFSGVMEVSVYKESYIDAASSSAYPDRLNPDLTINVWAISAEYRDFYVYTYMDTVTYALYDITILSKNTDFLYPAGTSENGYLEYLKAISDIPSGLRKPFSAAGYYAKRQISLCLYSIGADEQKIIYRFNKSVIAEKTDYPLYSVTDAGQTAESAAGK